MKMHVFAEESVGLSVGLYILVRYNPYALIKNLQKYFLGIQPSKLLFMILGSGQEGQWNDR